MSKLSDKALEIVRDTARRNGGTYLMSYELCGQDVPDSMREGYMAIEPGLSLKEALERASLSEDLVGRTLVVREVFNLNTNKPEAGFPSVINGLPVSATPGRGMN